MNQSDGKFANVSSSPHVQQQAVLPATVNSCMESPKEKYKSVLYGLGIVEIITGSLALILGIAAAAYWYIERDGYDFQQQSTFGIWCGVFAIVVGILGVRARSNPSQCVYNANIALSIIGAIVMGVLTILSGMSAGLPLHQIRSLIAIYSTVTVISFVAMVIMIIHSAYSCAGVCCKSDQGVAVFSEARAAGMQQPQLVQLANSQYVLAPAQMIASTCETAQNSIGEGAATHHSSLVEQMRPPSVMSTLQTSASVSQQATESIPPQDVQTEKEQETDDDLPLIP